MLNAFSVDVEDYFQVNAFEGSISRASWSSFEPRVERNTRRLLDLCAEHGVRGTFFTLGWVADRWPGLVREIRDAGHELATHGQDHRRVTTMTPGQFREDLRRSKRTIEDAAGVEVIGFRAPSYSIVRETMWAVDVLIEEGFHYDSSIFPIHHDRYGIPVSPRHPYVLSRPPASIVEAPGSTVKWGPFNLPVGGGGYFRILPYGWTRWGIRRLNEFEKLPAIFYLHPWEIDPDQPRLSAGRLSRFRHYRNLEKTEDRLRALLREFRFSTMMSLLHGQIREMRAEVGAASLPYVW